MDGALAARLEAMQSLARVDHDLLPLGVGALHLGEDGVLVIARLPRPSRLRFAIAGLEVHVSVAPTEDGGSVCQIWCEIGALPFSARGRERRRQVLEVLRATRDLPDVRFVLGARQTILALCESRHDGPPRPADLMHDLVLFLQQAQPFYALLAELLAPGLGPLRPPPDEAPPPAGSPGS